MKNRLAWGRRVQRHVYAVTFLAIAIGIGESAAGQLLIRTIVENFPDARQVNGVPLAVIVVVVSLTIVVDLFGGAIFDFDVSTVYRPRVQKTGPHGRRDGRAARLRLRCVSGLRPDSPLAAEPRTTARLFRI